MIDIDDGGQHVSTPQGRRRQPLRVPRVADAVAAKLRQRILDGDLVDGSELPTETALLAEFPASRPSLREAFRILETEGLVSVRRGKRGGTVINHPTADTAAYHIGLLLHSAKVPLSDLATARNLLEPLCAEQAALRPDHAAVGRTLRELSRAAEETVADGPSFTSAALDFHKGLVDASGNQTLRIVVGVLESIWSVQERGWARRAAAQRNYPPRESLEQVLRAHDAIAKAVEKGDPAGAVKATRRHLEAAQLYVTSDDSAPVRVLDDYGTPRMSVEF